METKKRKRTIAIYATHSYPQGGVLSSIWSPVVDELLSKQTEADISYLAY